MYCKENLCTNENQVELRVDFLQFTFSALFCDFCRVIFEKKFFWKYFRMLSDVHVVVGIRF